MKLPAAFPDDDPFPDEDEPRTYTLTGVTPAQSLAPLPDVHACTAGEFYAYCHSALTNRAERAQLGRSDLHVYTALINVLALAAENETLRKTLEVQQGQAQAYREALDAERAAKAAQLHAAIAENASIADAALRSELRAREAHADLLTRYADALAELDELDLLRGFYSASRAIAGQPVAALSTQLRVPPPTDDPFAPPWLAHGTDPAHEVVDADTIVVDPLDGGLQ